MHKRSFITILHIMEHLQIAKLEKEANVNFLTDSIKSLGDKLPVVLEATSKASFQKEIDKLEWNYVENLSGILSSPFNQSFIAKDTAERLENIKSLTEHNAVLDEEIESQKKISQETSLSKIAKDTAKKEVNKLMGIKATNVKAIEAHKVALTQNQDTLTSNLDNIERMLEFIPWFVERILVLKKYRDACKE